MHPHASAGAAIHMRCCIHLGVLPACPCYDCLLTLTAAHSHTRTDSMHSNALTHTLTLTHAFTHTLSTHTDVGTWILCMQQVPTPAAHHIAPEKLHFAFGAVAPFSGMHVCQLHTSRCDLHVCVAACVAWCFAVLAVYVFLCCVHCAVYVHLLGCVLHSCTCVTFTV